MSKTLCSYRTVVASAVLAASVVTIAAGPALAQRWQTANFPAPNAGVLVYTFIGGNPACASYNGRDCLWGQAANQIRFNQVRPLVCGANHRAQWGVTGYEDRRHWCNLAKRVTRFD